MWPFSTVLPNTWSDSLYMLYFSLTKKKAYYALCIWDAAIDWLRVLVADICAIRFGK